MDRPEFNTAAALQFVVNGKAGSSDAEATCAAIEAVLHSAGRIGTVTFAAPGDLVDVARAGAAAALATHSAVIAVGGDGTINTVAQAAHAVGCTMGVIPEGTFNYFAREHGVPPVRDAALHWLLDAQPEPVQISAVNEQVFLVNASLGVYPDLLQDRERWKARFGRSRAVAFVAGMSTLLRSRRRLGLTIEWQGTRRDMPTLTLFVGNNRLQLEQLGLHSMEGEVQRNVGEGHITAVILKPIGTMAMAGLMLRGALGQLGEADDIERVVCETLVVRQSRRWGQRRMKVAYDGEVTWLNAPLTFRVLPEPLWLLKGPPAASGSITPPVPGQATA